MQTSPSFFSVRATLACAIASLLVPLSQARAETAGETPIHHPQLGICTHFAQKEPSKLDWSPEKLMPRVADLGVGWIRDEILWREVEPRPGEYQVPEKTRKWVEMANASGLKVIACFADRHPLYQDQYDPSAYAKAAAYIAGALKGKLQAIEILNEPFGGYANFYGKGATWYGLEKDGTVTPWIKKYVVLFNQSAEAIRAANAEIKIIGLGSTTPVNYRQIEDGISPKADGITDHPYSFRTPPEVVPYRSTPSFIKDIGFPVTDEEGSFESYIQMMRSHSAKHHGPKEIWFTEWGYTTFREGASKKTFLYSGFTEEAQAKYALRRFMQSLALGVDVSCMYDLLDDGYDEFEAEHHFGILHKDLSPKPAYAAIRRLTRAMADMAPSNAIQWHLKPFSDRKETHPVQWDGGTLPALNKIYCYSFQNQNHETVLAAWSAERAGDLSPRAADLELELDPARYQAQVTDLLTGEISTPKQQARAGRLFLSQLAIPDHPILIQLAGKK